MKDATQDLVKLAQDVAEMAKRHGADAAEVVAKDALELSVKVRLGEIEHLQEAGSRGIGLRVFKDRKQAVTYTSDLRREQLSEFTKQAVELAQIAEPDPFHELPNAEWLAKSIPDLGLYDTAYEPVTAEYALKQAREAEKAAMADDKRITNSDGASFDRVLGSSAFANTGGFSGGYRGSYGSLSVEPMCEDEGGKKRKGFWWTASRYLNELATPESVGHEATKRALEQLGAKKIPTQEVPIIFDREISRSLVGTVFSVTNGAAMYRKSTYLLGRENTAIASSKVTIVDDPLIARAPGSRPFDGDGLTVRQNLVVDKGIFKTILCDVYSARRLERMPTGSAGRSIGGTPGPSTSNFFMLAGDISRDELISQTKRGLYVTSMMGFGFNPVTGDFSRGAQGVWIENGELTFPVSEVTISANFEEILQRIDLVANDLDLRTSTSAPTFRVSSMMVAGKS